MAQRQYPTAKLLAPIASVLIASFFSVSCGDDVKVKDFSKSSKDPSADANPNAEPTNTQGEADQLCGEVAIPPQEYYDALFTDAVKNADQQSLSLAGSDQILYVNFTGATLTRGYSRGQSFILCRQTATVPSAGLSPADIGSILEEVQRYFNEAGAKLVVTNERPTSGDFTTIHVGGSYSDLGCIGGGVLGIAPFDRGNANRNDIGFAFTKNIRSNRVIAETIAHEAAHSFGLDHVQSRKDLMFPSSTNEIEGFTVSRVSAGARIQDGPQELQKALGAGTTANQPIAQTPSGTDQPNGGSTGSTGSTTPKPATPTIPGLANLPSELGNLPGLPQIGNLGQLIPGLAQAGNLDISTLLQQALATLPAGTGITNLPQFDKILAAIGLSAQAGQNQNGANNKPATGLAGLAGSVLGNANLGGLGGLASLAGLGSAGSALTAVQAIINTISGKGNQGSQGQTPTLPQGLPDLSALLGIVGQNTSPADLINNLLASAQIVNSNYTDATKDALISLLKVGYSQAFTQVSGN